MRTTKTAIAFLAWIGFASAQVPTGSITGVVRDPSGAAVSAARVEVVSAATGLTRVITTSQQGDYGFPALLAGEYEVSVEAPGFQRSVRRAAVEAGTTTTADFTLHVGDTKDSVIVDGATPQMHYESHTIGGVVTQDQIEGLPLNGRSFLELAKLEPGVQPPTRQNNNRTFVSVLGAPPNGRTTRVTVDGGSVMSVGSGGSAMGFSQEVVQEFQISTVNFDLSTGITYGGAINVVTRSGGNDLHGTGFYFFRDHKLAAYPALNRDSANPDPFFQRRQFGFCMGGPIRRRRAFFFGNWERNEQRGVVATTLLAPEFAHFSRITPSPLFGDLVNVRLDGQIGKAHTAFVRYSHDGSRAFSPSSTASGNNATVLFAYPSQWTRQSAWVDQNLLGITSVLRPTLVNDFRFSYFFASTAETPPGERDCAGCLGFGAPRIDIPQAGLYIGNSSAVYDAGRQFQFTDTLAWQRRTHRVRFGADVEHHRRGTLALQNEPATITLFPPDQARRSNIPLPASFQSLNDILQLPLQSATIAVGAPRVPQENGGLARTWDTARLFFQDTWRVHSRFTVNYGLGWNLDRDLNYDLRKPALLAPILGADGLGPTRKRWTNFSPALGLAWAPSPDGRTVVRAGAGVFYDSLLSPTLDAERAALGPPGLGRTTWMPFDFRGSPTLFRGSDLMAILPALRADKLQMLASADRTVQAIQVNKQVLGGGVLQPPDVPSPSALHVNIGLQREVVRDFVVSADFAYRHFAHGILSSASGGGGIDLNHFNSIHGRVIPKCIGAQADDPQAICSLGPINVQEYVGRATYKGLLLRAEKRFSRGFQVLGSYAYSSNTGTNNGNGFDLDHWLQNSGPLKDDFTHVLNLAGVVQLPRRFEMGLNFSYSSVPPFSAYVGAGTTGIDFNGDGTTGDLLPGTTVNAFNRGMNRADLERLVAQFNATDALTKDAQGRMIPPVTLPAHYSFGDNFHSLDLRLTRSFVLRERWRWSLVGEVFNLYNKANLSGYSGDLTSAAFGQPTSRATQVFGSGGPRAFQLAVRVAF